MTILNEAEDWVLKFSRVTLVIVKLDSTNSIAKRLEVIN